MQPTSGAARTWEYHTPQINPPKELSPPDGKPIPAANLAYFYNRNYPEAAGKAPPPYAVTPYEEEIFRAALRGGTQRWPVPVEEDKRVKVLQAVAFSTWVIGAVALSVWVGYKYYRSLKN